VAGTGDGDGDGDGDDGMDAEENEDPAALKKALMEKKAALKQAFDSDYDGHKKEDGDEDGEGAGRKRKFHADDDELDYFSEMKDKINRQQEINRQAFASERDPHRRAMLEGFPPGKYVRIEVEGVSCELVEYFSPYYPIVVGGLLHGEDNFGYVQIRIKKHRWHKKILKTNDPLIFSLGWRRFQSMPLYSIQGTAPLHSLSSLELNT